MTPARFPHSDTPGSTLGCQLPRAYRRLLRPSSALDAKASTMCPSQLVTHTTNPHHPPTGGRTRQAMHTTRHKRTTHPAHNQTGHDTGCAKNKKKHTHPTRTNRSRAQVHLQMLASTIQISNNNPTPDTDTPTAPTAQQGGAEAQTLPTRSTTPDGTGGLIPQNPN